VLKEKTLYVAVWAILVLATFMEVATRSVQAAAAFVAVGIITISIVKAMLIATIYQNLRREAKALLFFPGSALIVFAILIIVAILGGAMMA
jgi:hypothetical protein